MELTAPETTSRKSPVVRRGIVEEPTIGFQVEYGIIGSSIISLTISIAESSMTRLRIGRVELRAMGCVSQSAGSWIDDYVWFEVHQDHSSLICSGIASGTPDQYLALILMSWP